jgi:ABC-type branched-subunit amino acid transport system ATPase component
LKKPILQVRNVTKHFGGVVANDAVSFDVPKGAIVGMKEPNGLGQDDLVQRHYRQSRALIMAPQTLLVDEPSIGLEPRAIDMILDTLEELREMPKHHADPGRAERPQRAGVRRYRLCALVAGRVVRAAKGSALLDDPEIAGCFGRLD